MFFRVASFALLASTLTLTFTLTACPDWSQFGDGQGDDDDDDDDGNEGEGEGAEGEGEGEGNEGEGEGEGEGGPSGPLWGVVDVPVAAQAELAFAAKSQLSSSQGRLFAVGTEHIYELVDESLETIFTLEVPCNDVQLFGPVAVDGTDLLVATAAGAVRIHDDGSCDPEYSVNVSGGRPTVAPLAGGALVYDGQTLTLVDEDGVEVDTHSFEDFTEGDFYPDPDATGDDALLLVRRFSLSAGQVVRVTKPGTELIIEPVFDQAMMLAAGQPVNINAASRFAARFLDVTVDPSAPTPLTAELRIADGDGLQAFASDDNGEIAGVGSSALVAIADVNAPTLELTSVTGARYGTLSRFVKAPSGELWAIGDRAMLYWTASAALARSNPSIIEIDQFAQVPGPVVAISGSLFFADDNLELRRADVDTAGNALDFIEIVDAVSFSPIAIDGQARLAFIAADDANDAPARIVEVTRSFVRVYELGDALDSVTATLFTSISGNFFNTPSSLAVLEDGSKAAFLSSSTLFVCSIELEVGVAPVVTCDGGRSSSVSFGQITVVDPSPGVDDETYVVAGSGGVGVVEPGEQGRFLSIDSDGSAPALLVNGCVLGFSSSARSWSALNPDQPDAPAGRRGFAALDAIVLGEHVLVVGGDGSAGQLGHFKAPTSSTCRDAANDPVLESAAMMGGERRTQVGVSAASFLAGELYVLDEDGLVWHVPTP